VSGVRLRVVLGGEELRFVTAAARPAVACVIVEWLISLPRSAWVLHDQLPQIELQAQQRFAVSVPVGTRIVARCRCEGVERLLPFVEEGDPNAN
jgi:hypothetical protein